MKPLNAIIRSIPTAVVFAILGGIGYWGHHTGWTITTSSAELVDSQNAAAKSEDWCEAHNVKQSECLACNPELGGADPADWCKEHGVPESKCSVCHPEILTGAAASDWCREHAVPESQCTLCHPEIALKGEAPESSSGIRVTRDPKAKPAENPATCQTHLIRVQFASVDSLKKAGVELEGVVERPMTSRIRANGEIGYDQTRLARLAARVPGTVWRVDAELGQRVKKGDLLALVDALEVGRIKAELLNAMAQLDVRTKTFARMKASEKEGFRTNAELQEADAAVREARVHLLAARQKLANLGLPIELENLHKLSEAELVGRLRFLGLPKEVVESLDASMATANLIPVVAPLDGVVVARNAVRGELADVSKPLFTVADVSKVWALLDIRPEDISSVKPGQSVTFCCDGGDQSATGSISWISTELDDKTRTVKVRAVLDNPDGDLRTNTFGTARIVIRSEPTAVAVSQEAIHWEGCSHVVFVRMTDTVFQTRKVRLGTRSGLFTEVRIGLLPGEVVATTGSHVLKSALLKSRLGAGCVDD